MPAHRIAITSGTLAVIFGTIGAAAQFGDDDRHFEVAVAVVLIGAVAVGCAWVAGSFRTGHRPADDA